MSLITDLSIEVLVHSLCASYVRRETRFYHVDSPDQALSRRDVEQAFIATLGNNFPAELLTSTLLKQTFDIAIERKHTDRAKSVPVWGGSMACHPGNPNRLLWKENGTVRTVIADGKRTRPLPGRQQRRSQLKRF